MFLNVFWIVNTLFRRSKWIFSKLNEKFAKDCTSMGNIGEITNKWIRTIVTDYGKIMVLCNEWKFNIYTITNCSPNALFVAKEKTSLFYNDQSYISECLQRLSIILGFLRWVLSTIMGVISCIKWCNDRRLIS